MAIQDVTTTQLLTDVSQLIDDMVLELELRGCEANYELIKRAVLMQQQLKKLQEN